MADNWWLASLWQPFKWSRDNTHAHSGVDKGMPCGSPVAAPVTGKIIGAGWKPWGYQVDMLVNGSDMPSGYDQSSPHVLSFLHMSRGDVDVGTNVSPGQQLGLSGQPPPGAGFGSGCHVHFEVTHGDVAPYEGQYSPWHPNSTSYPVDGQPFIDTLTSNGLAASTGTAAQQGSSTLAATSSSSGGWDWGEFWRGVVGGIPVVGGIINGAIGASGATGVQFNALFSWISNPVRLLKLAVGVGLIFTALLVTFVGPLVPDAAAVGVAAAGAPEAAPAVHAALSSKRPVKSGAQAAGRRYVQSQQQEKSGAQKQRQQQALSSAHAKGRAAGAEDEVRRQRLKRIAAGKKAAETRRANKAKASTS